MAKGKDVSPDDPNWKANEERLEREYQAAQRKWVAEQERRRKTAEDRARKEQQKRDEGR